jgi:hypothetical protein
MALATDRRIYRQGPPLLHAVPAKGGVNYRLGAIIGLNDDGLGERASAAKKLRIVGILKKAVDATNLADGEAMLEVEAMCRHTVTIAAGASRVPGAPVYTHDDETVATTEQLIGPYANLAGVLVGPCDDQLAASDEWLVFFPGIDLSAAFETDAGERGFFPVAASTTITAGHVVGLDASGNLVPVTDSAIIKVLGVAPITVDNSTGAAGDKSAPVIVEAPFLVTNLTASGLTAADVGKPAFGGATAGAFVLGGSRYANRLGKVIGVNSGTSATILVEPLTGLDRGIAGVLPADRLSVPLAASVAAGAAGDILMAVGGYAKTAASAANAAVIGAAGAAYVNAGSAGAARVEVLRGRRVLCTGTGFAQTDVGANVYATGARAVQKVAEPGGTDVLAGTIDEFVSSTSVWVRLVA